MKWQLLSLLVLLSLGGSAHAGAKTLTLLGVSGPGGAKMASQLERELGDLYQMVPGDQYRETAQEMGKPGASPEEVSAVATAMHIDAVIGASIVGSGHSRVLLIAVRDGASGRVIARGRYELARGPIKDRLLADLLQALDRSSGRGSSEDEAPPLGSHQGTTAISRRAPERARELAGFSASVGPSLGRRSLIIDGPSSPDYWAGAMVGLRVSAALFPFAFSSSFAHQHPVLASFGLLGGYEHLFGFQVSTVTGDSTGHGERGYALLAGRIPLGHQAIGGTLQVESGYAHTGFSHVSPSAVGVPDVSYELLDLGLSWDRALGVSWALLSARFAYLQPLGAGDITSADQYGRASAWGFEAGGALTFVPLKWLWLRVEGGYDRVSLTFRGTGAIKANASADAFPSGALTIGVAL
jgi:hypothetical protein